MVESLQVSAQLTTVVEVDVTRIARLRDQEGDFAAARREACRSPRSSRSPRSRHSASTRRETRRSTWRPHGHYPMPSTSAWRWTPSAVLHGPGHQGRRRPNRPPARRIADPGRAHPDQQGHPRTSCPAATFTLTKPAAGARCSTRRSSTSPAGRHPRPGTVVKPGASWTTPSLGEIIVRASWSNLAPVVRPTDRRRRRRGPLPHQP